MMLKIGGVELIPGRDFLVDPFSAPVKGKFETIILDKGKMTDEQAVVSAIQSSTGKFLIIDERKYEPGDKEEEQNLIGFIKGKAQPDSFLVVTAHYDHLGKMGRDTYFPGANDNSSGIAMLLSLATHYSRNPHDYSFVFIATGAEELGLLGSGYFTEHPLFDLSRITFLVNFDLAGTGEEGVRIVNGSVYKKEFDIITRLNNEHQLLPKIDIRGAACNSDHCMFHEKGVRCFFIYTQGGIKAYHDIYDKYETLPLTEFVDYMQLMTLFFDEIIR